MKKLIVTGDDFGLAVPINEAIERAHREGILTAASLMVGSPAAADAIRRARSLPSLKVGLHVVVVRGLATLPHAAIPLITDQAGMLPADLFRAGVLFFFSTTARRQLEAEIRAQFDAFRVTGLPLDHVDAHNHLHYHPTVLGIILRVGRDYGVRAIRLPWEPFLPAWRAAGNRFGARLMWSIFLWPWLTLMRARIRRAGLIANDAMFGMGETGHMTRDRVLRIIDELPEGVSEIYFHPATTSWDEADSLTERYDRQGELAALTSADVMAALQRRGVQCTTFSEVADV